MKQILTGRIGASLSLFGRRGFFFESDNGANANGAVNTGTTENNQGNQEGQNNQQTEPVNPFAQIDRSLMDDHTRTQLEKAEAEFKNVQGRAAQASKFQAEKDRLEALTKQYEQNLQQLQRGNNQNQNHNQPANPEPKTYREELIDLYVKENFTLKDAERLADLREKESKMFGSRFQNGLHQQLAPFINSANEQAARSAFEQAEQMDTHGLFANEQLAQQTWEQVNAVAASGQPVSPEMILNLARIKSFEINGVPNTQVSNSPAPLNMQTRLTYPGAGSHARIPNTTRNNDVIDPETQAAVAATISSWPIQPKGFVRPASMAGKITRGDR